MRLPSRLRHSGLILRTILGAVACKLCMQACVATWEPDSTDPRSHKPGLDCRKQRNPPRERRSFLLKFQKIPGISSRTRTIDFLVSHITRGGLEVKWWDSGGCKIKRLTV